MVTLDAATYGNGSGDNEDGVRTFNHTVADKENRILLAAMGMQGTLSQVISATYNGQSLTQLYSTLVQSTYLYVGYIVNPTIGTNEMNFAVESEAESAKLYRASCVSFYGVDTNNPIGGSAHTERQDNNTSTIVDTVTVEGAAGLIVDFFMATRMASGNAKTPQTGLWNISGQWNSVFASDGKLFGASFRSHSGSDTDMEWENLSAQSGLSDQLHTAFELLPKPVAAALTPSII